MDLFETVPLQDLIGTPLAERLRPAQLQGLQGQEAVVRQLEQFLKAKFLPNLIFWGPPGTGKTTTAQALAKEFECHFLQINATSTGAKELRELGESARRRRLENSVRTLLFVDEIHRFNKGQQDVLLPFLERGDMTLVGATTENPSYELNRALLSRCRLLVFSRLADDSLTAILKRATVQQGKDWEHFLTPEAQVWLLNWSDGDARRALTALEGLLALDHDGAWTRDQLQTELGSLVLGHDKASDQHYDLISAFIKSIRGSDADAGLYYLARMIKGGEDPVFIARRLVILASEDVGNADPRALQIAINGAQAVEMIGWPEGAISLAQVVTYLASAPKSNRSYLGLQKAKDWVEKTGASPVPLFLRSSNTAATADVKPQDAGPQSQKSDYQYPHDYPRHFVSQNYFPAGAEPKEAFYQPDDIGFEKSIREFQNWLRQNTR